MTSVKAGYFGAYGGRFVPEVLIPAIDQLTIAYEEAMADPFVHRRASSGVPPVLRPADSALPGGTPLEGDRWRPIYLKREDLNHTGAHKINNTIGQILLARRMGKRRIIAETGAGQHGVATATVCAMFGLECVVYMGEEDIRRQALNVFRMKLLGAEVRPVTSGTPHAQGRDQRGHPRLGDPRRDHVLHDRLGRGPASRIRPWCGISSRSSARGARSRCSRRRAGSRRGRRLRRRGKQRHRHIPSVRRRSGGPADRRGGGEARASDRPPRRVAYRRARRGVLHGSLSYILQDEDGQILLAHSISAGLDYPGVGPEHSLPQGFGPRRRMSP